MDALAVKATPCQKRVLHVLGKAHEQLHGSAVYAKRGDLLSCRDMVAAANRYLVLAMGEINGSIAPESAEHFARGAASKGL